MLFLIFLIILFPTLKFKGLTLIALCDWFNLHPFAFYIFCTVVISEIIMIAKDVIKGK